MAAQQIRESGAGPAAVLNHRTAVRLRPVAASDYTALARFLSNFTNETRSEQFWHSRLQYWWDENPAFREGVPRGWLLSANEEIKGFLGNIPTYFQLNRRVVTALSTTTWRVMPKYRNHSLILLYEAIRCASGSILFNTTPSDDADRVMRGMRFARFSYCAEPRKSLIIVNTARVLSSRARNKVIGAIGGWFGAPILHLLQASRARLGHRAKYSRVQVLTQAESCFDELWERTCDCYAHTNIRSAEAIQWLCFGNQQVPKTLFGCFVGERLVGYLILVKVRREALTRLLCVDLWMDPGVPTALRDLLSFVKTWAGKEGVDVIEIPHFDERLGSRLSKLGLWHRRYTGEQPAYYKAPHLAELNPAESYLVELQGDRGL